MRDIPRNIQWNCAFTAIQQLNRTRKRKRPHLTQPLGHSFATQATRLSSYSILPHPSDISHAIKLPSLYTKDVQKNKQTCVYTCTTLATSSSVFVKTCSMWNRFRSPKSTQQNGTFPETETPSADQRTLSISEYEEKLQLLQQDAEASSKVVNILIDQGNALQIETDSIRMVARCSMNAAMLMDAQHKLDTVTLHAKAMSWKAIATASLELNAAPKQ